MQILNTFTNYFVNVVKNLPHFWARYPQNYPQYFAVHQSFFLKLSPIFLQDHYFVLVRYKYKTPAKAGIIYLFITSKKKTSLSRFFGPAFIMYVEWDSGDYSARMRNEPPPPRHNVERRRNDFVSLCDAQHQAEPLQSAIFSQ